ncbi:hypothetical protein BDV59DRAFT_190141 [Aspergillus ambiguus]|uniref:putative Sin3 complex subunit (Stb2) n=1 Tax=Aspergillus ambiguus TaxID=176160 RepID=UPI003CCD74CC
MFPTRRPVEKRLVLFSSLILYPIRNTTPNAPRHAHQKLVFTDPVALRYLEEDPSTIVLHRRLTLHGYDIYIVEQWACSRIHPTFIITTYTGDPSHQVVAGVLGVPTDESTWSPRLKLYFSAVTQCQARRHETPLGALMVTDLSQFPSALTVIPVPGGDTLKHKEDFVVNENLKRLNCAGRAGLKLQPPSAATEAKFHQLYRTSERVPLYSAVPELVKQCQIALMMFGVLAPEYVDGLLCDVTEAAIADWWTDIGIDLYNIEPSDGILGPTTVAALLGTLMGARNRLHACGAPVAKDPFDIASLKRGISSFQKNQKLPRSRRLDRTTLDRLHRVTAKAATADGWTDAVKSTMAELSGHGGEMVMGMVRGRDKAGIADVETLDIDLLAPLVAGERAKWLWRGKPRKSAAAAAAAVVPTPAEGFASGTPTADMMFTTDDQGGYVWTSRKRRSTEELAAAADHADSSHLRPGKPPDASSAPGDDKDQNLSRMVRRGVSGKVSDARIGFGRFKDAVGIPGLRSHLQRPHKDGPEMVDAAYMPPVESDGENQTEPESVTEEPEPPPAATASQDEPPPTATPPPAAGPQSQTQPPAITVEPAATPDEPPPPLSSSPPPPAPLHRPSVPRSDDETPDLERSKTRSSDASAAEREQASALGMLSLRRPRSCVELTPGDPLARMDSYWPRHLSFSTVEEVMLGWEELRDGDSDGGADVAVEDAGALGAAMVREEVLAADARVFGAQIQELSEQTVPWVERQVGSVDELNRCLYESHEKVNAAYLERLNQYQEIRDRSSDLLTEEHSALTDQMRRVELVGAKLDYELHVLGSKVEDVETGLGEFERHVDDIETRIKTLVRGGEKQNTSWLAWLGRWAGFAT